MTPAQHDSLLAARGRILEALVDEMQVRSLHDDWEMRERAAVALAANRYAHDHYLNRTNVAQVEAIEHLACGHIDYASKLALYVAELIHGYR